MSVYSRMRSALVFRKNIAVLVASSFAVIFLCFSKAKAGERFGVYVAVTSGFAVGPARAVTLANSKFYRRAANRWHMEPNHQAYYFRPFEYYDYTTRPREKYRRRNSFRRWQKNETISTCSSPTKNLWVYQFRMVTFNSSKTTMSTTIVSPIYMIFPSLPLE